MKKMGGKWVVGALMLAVVMVVGRASASSTQSDFDSCLDHCPQDDTEFFCIMECGSKYPPANLASSTQNDFQSCVKLCPIETRISCVLTCGRKYPPAKLDSFTPNLWFPAPTNSFDKEDAASRYCHLGCTSSKCANLKKSKARGLLALTACINVCSHICAPTKPSGIAAVA